MKKAYILLAEGFEIIEAFAPHDILTRCGVTVKTVAIGEGKSVASSHGVAVTADLPLAETDLGDGDLLILPGGYPGYARLGESKAVGDVLKAYYNGGKLVGVICGAPTVLVKNGLAADRKLTCHSGVRDQMGAYQVTGNIVEKDGNLITGVGAGRALEFGFLLAETLTDAETVKKAKQGMQIL